MLPTPVDPVIPLQVLVQISPWSSQASYKARFVTGQMGGVRGGWRFVNPSFQHAGHS